MSELVADCPRCGSKRMTFDITKEHFTHVRYDWQYWFEAFSICRHCKRATIFVLSQNTNSDKTVVQNNGLVNLSFAVNRYMNIEGFINLKDTVAVQPPDHLPIDIEAAFREGAACMSIG